MGGDVEGWCEAYYVTVCYTGTETVSEGRSQNARYHQRRVNYTD